MPKHRTIMDSAFNTVWEVGSVSPNHGQITKSEMHRISAFHSEICLHCEIVPDPDLVEAKSYCRSAETRHHYLILADSFRCYGIENKAILSLSQFPDLSGIGQEVFEHCRTVRPFRTSG
jgi:hypothetical protein